MKNNSPRVALVLHNIRSAYNVGSIMRTADAAGVEKIYMTGYTSAPFDRFGRAKKEISKTALGAEKSVQWEYVKNPVSLLSKLSRDGWSIVGVELDKLAKDYRTSLPSKKVFVFGNEVRGLSKSIKDKCNVLIEIPMRGEKESLNVSVAAGIVLFAD